MSKLENCNGVRFHRFQKGEHEYCFRWDENSDGELVRTLQAFADDIDCNFDRDDVVHLANFLIGSLGKKFVQNVNRYYEVNKPQQSL